MHRNDVIRQARFIPTHVGNAWLYIVVALAGAVHPHARGERGCIWLLRSRVDGSSPRTWGTRYRSVTYLTDLRFIPTHVGNARCR